MALRRFGTALIFPSVCLTVGLLSPGTLSPALAACAIVTIVLTVAGFGAIEGSAWLATRGRVSFFSACQFSHGIALTAFYLLWPLSSAMAAAAILILLRLNWLPFQLFMIALQVAPALWVLLWLMRAAPKRMQPLRAWGRVGPPESWPALKVFLDRLCFTLGCTTPRQVVLSLEPGIFFTPRAVQVGEEIYRDGTLLLSLPLCRILPEAELAALVAADLIRSEPVPSEWAEWFPAAANRVEFLMNLRGGIIMAPLFAVPAAWREKWAGLEAGLAQFALQRAAVTAGRENTALALARTVFDNDQWQTFVNGIQGSLRAGAEPDENLSRRFADVLQAAVAAPDFVSLFEDPDGAALVEKYPGLAACFRLLEVAPSGIAERLREAQAEPSIMLIEGAEELERELTPELHKRVFFVR